jgi:hypothetical protein
MEISSNIVVSEILNWCQNSIPLFVCHDTLNIEYKQILSMVSDSVWSVSCTSTNYITSKAGKCKYVCPVFSQAGSLETRAVGEGQIIFTEKHAPHSYIGKLQYYIRSVRFSSHSSGKCYDCNTAYTNVRHLYDSPVSTPVVGEFIKFNNRFINNEEDF